MPRLILHIGAHKTATSYMQKKLALNGDLLERHGLHYIPREVFRREFTALGKDRLPANEWTEALAETARGGNVVISEENISGVPADLVFDGTYYGRAGERLARTCRLLGVETPEVYFALREYAAFTVSMYGEYIRHRDFLKFAEYRRIYEASGFTWVKVVEDLLTAVPGAKLTLWDFGRFRDIENDVFAAMLDIDPHGLRNPDGPVRESFSEAAMRAFEALDGALSPAEMKKVMGPVARHLAKSDGYAAFEPYPTDVTERMRAQYDADLRTIAARFPQATFLGGI